MARTSKPKVRPKTIDEYLAALGKDQRAALQRLRKIIRSVAPRAEECISYDLPTFRPRRKAADLFWRLGDHYALYGVAAPCQKETKDYDTSRGNIRFEPDKPLPAAVLRKLVMGQIAKCTDNVS